MIRIIPIALAATVIATTPATAKPIRVDAWFDCSVTRSVVVDVSDSTGDDAIRAAAKRHGQPETWPITDTVDCKYSDGETYDLTDPHDRALIGAPDPAGEHPRYRLTMTWHGANAPQAAVLRDTITLPDCAAEIADIARPEIVSYHTDAGENLPLPSDAAFTCDPIN